MGLPLFILHHERDEQELQEALRLSMEVSDAPYGIESQSISTSEVGGAQYPDTVDSSLVCL